MSLVKIKSPSLGFLETFDPMGHEWNFNEKNAFQMTRELAETRVAILIAAGFTDAAIVPPVDLTTLPIFGLAALIRKDWRPVNFAARPYLDAMGSLTTLKQSYGADDGPSVVNYFLSNASQWKGETAKAIKKELNRRLKENMRKPAYS